MKLVMQLFGGDCIAIDESIFDIGDSEQGTFKIKATSVAGNEVSFSVIVKNMNILLIIL